MVLLTAVDIWCTDMYVSVRTVMKYGTVQTVAT